MIEMTVGQALAIADHHRALVAGHPAGSFTTADALVTLADAWLASDGVVIGDGSPVGERTVTISCDVTELVAALDRLRSTLTGAST